MGRIWLTDHTRRSSAGEGLELKARDGLGEDSVDSTAYNPTPRLDRRSMLFEDPLLACHIMTISSLRATEVVIFKV